MDILDQYVMRPPHHQNAIDLFDGEWSSTLPADSGLVARPGHAGLFDDGRIHWLDEVVGGVDGMRVLELGPLEGAHSAMLQRLGAREVLAIEANARAYLKCLIVKEALSLDRVRFLLGDFTSYLDETDDHFDAVVASGVLYHMLDPVGLLRGLRRVADRALIWTHYYDADLCARDELRRRFGPPEHTTADGVTVELRPYRYLESLEWSGFCGGAHPDARWLTRASLMSLLDAHGWSDIRVEFDHPDHPGGPALAVVVQSAA